MSEAQIKYTDDYQRDHLFFCKVEDIRDDPVTGDVQVHCKNHNCVNSKELGGWFTPTKLQINNRIIDLESKNGRGGCYFYCSEECKNSCDLFNKSVAQLMKRDTAIAGLAVDLGAEGTEIWRQEVFKRNINEHGKLQCEICGSTDEHGLSAHHEKPQKTHPEMALDPDNGWVLCSFGKGNGCHLKYGHPKNTSCSTGELSKLICERKIKKK